MNFQTVITKIAEVLPNTHLRDAIALAEVLSTPEFPIADAARLVIARTNTAVRADVEAGRRIQAIKTLRDLTRCGLREAEDTIDEAYPRVTDDLAPLSTWGAPAYEDDNLPF